MARKSIDVEALKKIPEQFAKVPMMFKAVALVGIVGLAGAVYYFVFYSETQTTKATIEKRVSKLKSELVKLEEYKRDERVQEKERERKEGMLKNLEAQLPADTNPIEFQADLFRRAKLAGVRLGTINQGEPVVEGEFKSVPFTLTLTGSYVQIGQFFNHISRIERIVRVSNVTIGLTEKRPDHHLLSANFTAAAFQAVTDADRAKAAAGAPAAPSPPPKGGKGGKKKKKGKHE